MDAHRVGQLVAALLLGTLVERWRLVTMVLYPQNIYVFLVGGTWLALVLASANGLFKGRRWGAYLLLVLAPFSTIMLSIPLVPGVSLLLGIQGPTTMIALNVAMLVAGVVLARTLDRSRLGEPAR